MATTVATSLLGYIYWIVAARMYSPHDVGLASALLAATTVAAALSNLGLGQTLVQILPQRAAGQAWSLTVTAAFMMVTITGLFAGAGTLLILSLSHQLALAGHNPAYALLIVVGVPLWTASTLIDFVFIAERAAGHMLARNVAFATFKILLLVAPLLFFRSQGVLAILGSWIVAGALAILGGFMILIPRLGRDYRPLLRGLRAQVRSMRSLLAGNYLITLGSVGLMYLLQIVVSTRLSPTDNAYFYTTWMVGGFFFMVETSVASALFAEGSHSAQDIQRKVRSSALFIGALLIPAMLLFFIGGRYIIAIFGPSYPRHGLPLLTVLVIAAIPDGITNIYVSVLRVERRLWYAGLLNASMAVLTLVLAWILLPVLGIVGAGWAWLAAQSAGSIVVLIDVLVRRAHRRGASATHSQQGDSGPFSGEQRVSDGGPVGGGHGVQDQRMRPYTYSGPLMREHGMGADEALPADRHALVQRTACGEAAVAVVVGRGLHAPWNEGTRVVARNIGAALRGAGHQTRIMSLSHIEALQVQGEDPSLIHHISAHISSRGSLAALSDYRYLWRVARARKALEATSTFTPQVYHLVNLPLALAPFVRSSQRRVIVHVTLSHQAYYPLMEKIRAAIGWRLFSRWIDAYACTSEQIRHDLIQRGYKAHQVHVVPPPIDLQLFRHIDRAQARAALGWDPAAFVVLYLGTVSPLRFPAGAVVQALQLAAPCIPHLTLKVFAPVATHSYNVAWADENVRRAAEDATVPVHVQLEDVGEERKALLYSAADIVLLPFTAPVAVEPPLTLLEAMACQATVAVAPFANRSHVVDDGINGAVFTSAEHLAECLRCLYDLGSHGREEIGRAARATIVRRYSFEATSRTIEQLWSTLGIRPITDPEIAPERVAT